MALRDASWIAAELMNIDKRNPDWLYETFVVICTVATVAMDLVAKKWSVVETY